MGKINVLGFDVANLIAAGEVVDRPASVVKELCENSIDAGAKNITVEIKHGGISFIRVTDNGNGIEPDDVPMTVLRHATSKIATADDLASIGTLGFRGEALAAIAAVCHLKIITRTRDSAMGTSMQCDGGEITDISETGCAQGTSVVATELFYNVPARRKFLKKDTSECAAVTAVMEKIALSSPDVSLKYISDGEVKFMTAGDGNLLGTIYSLYGKAVAGRMTKVDRTSPEGIRVEGYISEPDIVKSNKNSENFFINGRFIKSKTAMAALEQAYSTRIPSQKFPVCVLNIHINTTLVDVNVHPSKLEAKFADERIVFEAVYYAVLNALTQTAERPEFDIGAGTGYRPSSKPSAANAFVPVTAPREEKPSGSQMKISAGSSYHRTEYNDVPFTMNSGTKSVEKMAETIRTIKETLEEEKKPEENESTEMPAGENAGVPEYKIIGEAYNTYVMVELSDRILMIDKHAAHERILFDEMCERMLENTRRSQVLMYPSSIVIDDTEAEALKDFGDKIKSLGFNYEIKGKELIVSEIPSEIGRESAMDMITSLASELAEGVGSIEATEARFFEGKLYQASCKAAIKGGRVYGVDHIKWICDRLLKAPDETGAVIKTCPHGRPVAFEIKKTSIDRQFDRIK